MHNYFIYDTVHIQRDVFVSKWYNAKMLRKNWFNGKTNLITINSHIDPTFDTKHQKPLAGQILSELCSETYHILLI